MKGNRLVAGVTLVLVAGARSGDLAGDVLPGWPSS